MNIEKLVYSMLKENTGIAIMDSGGDSNRGWQRNKNKSLDDFENEPTVNIEPLNFDGKKTVSSEDLEYTISVFHFLTNGQLELDTLCDEYNALSCDDWDGDVEAHGVSKIQAKWLEDHNLTIKDMWNTSNGDSSLSQVLQVLQGSHVFTSEDEQYILLQVHGGCDIRGGYTDAKLFKVYDVFGSEHVHGNIGDVQVDNMYDSVTITNEDGEHIKIGKKDKAKLELSEY